MGLTWLNRSAYESCNEPWNEKNPTINSAGGATGETDSNSVQQLVCFTIDDRLEHVTRPNWANYTDAPNRAPLGLPLNNEAL